MKRTINDELYKMLNDRMDAGEKLSVWQGVNFAKQDKEAEKLMYDMHSNLIEKYPDAIVISDEILLPIEPYNKNKGENK